MALLLPMREIGCCFCHGGTLLPMQTNRTSGWFQPRNAGLLVALGASLLVSSTSRAADVFAPGVMKVEFFNALDGVDINTLLGADKYVNNTPDAVQYTTSFTSPNGYGDNYGSRVSGFLTPTVSGDYDFFIRADDQAQLYISTDDKLANAVVVAEELSGCCQAFLEPGVPETTQAPITLVAGKRYYIYALLKEGGGGDWMEVAWRKTGDTTAAGSLKPLAGSVIGTFAPPGTVSITGQPVAVTTIEGVKAKFSVAVTVNSVSSAAYQWRKNGADIAGANSASYQTPILAVSDSGAKYSVKVSVPGAEVVSSEVVLTVNKDTVPPALVSAGAVKHGTGDFDVAVIFDEAVDPATVVAANFTLSAGTIKSVRYVKNSSTLDSFEQGAVITASGLTQGNAYSATVKNVSDLKGNKITSANINFTVSKLVWTALGAGDTAEFPAAALAVADNGFNLNSGGNAFWGTSDDVTFVYEEITGDFDKIARLEGQDASSQWARAGLHARTTLDTGDTAARYQQVHGNPTIKADGGASNYAYETNRRLNIGGATSSSSGGGTPAYPHAWLRLRRSGDVIHMYRSDNAITWTEFTPTDFNPADGSNVDGPLPAKMYVGPVFGPENGNIDAAFKGIWTAKIRDYSDYKPSKPAGKQTYSIGLNFQDSNTPNGLGPKEVAGVGSIAQANWNNMEAIAASTAPVSVSADVAGVAKSSTATVEWTCPNTWESTGRGEENNNFVGSDRVLMTGYLDTGGASTTKVTLNNLPADLTGAAGGYDVVLYAQGGVAKADRGGGYRITDLNGTELKPVVLGMSDDSPTDFVQLKSADATAHPKGTYAVFKGLTAKGIIVEGSTENGWASGSTPRAPINGLQLVVPSGAVDAAVTEKPTISAKGSVITFTGTLQGSGTVNGSYSDVAGAKSPYTVPAGAAQGFFRARQ